MFKTYTTHNYHKTAIHSLFTAKLGLLLCILFFPLTAFSTLATPTGQQIIPSYVAPNSPVVRSSFRSSKPIAVGKAYDESGNLTLQVRTDTFREPMNAYLGFTAPSIFGDKLMLITETGNIKPLSNGLVPWKTNISSLDEQPLGEVPLDLLPGDNYTFYLLISKVDNINDNYLWSATLSLTPTVLEFADAFIAKFPDGVKAPMTMLFSTDQGYSLEQIVTMTMAGNINEDGQLFDSSNVLLIPKNEALGLLTNNQIKKSFEETYSNERLESLLTDYKSLLESRGKEDPPTNHEALAILLLLLSDQHGLSTSDRLNGILQGFLLIKEFRMPEEPKSRTAFLQNMNNFAQLYDGPLDDTESSPVKPVSLTQGVFRNRDPIASDSSNFAYRYDRNSVILYAYDPDVPEDPDGHNLTYEIIQEPEHGTLSGSRQFRQYIPNEQYSGPDFLTFRVFDGKAYSNTATVEFVVKNRRLVLDRIEFSKDNGLVNDLCPKVTPSSTDVCRKTVQINSGRENTEIFSLNKNKGIYQFSEVNIHTNFVRSDYKATFTFDSPPTIISRGETLLPLTIDGLAEGFTTGWFIEKGFVYYTALTDSRAVYYNYANKDHDTDVYISNRELTYNESTGKFEGSMPRSDNTEIDIPKTAKDGFVIGGRFGWDPAFFISWIYKFEEE